MTTQNPWNAPGDLSDQPDKPSTIPALSDSGAENVPPPAAPEPLSEDVKQAVTDARLFADKLQHGPLMSEVANAAGIELHRLLDVIEGAL